MRPKRNIYEIISISLAVEHRDGLAVRHPSVRQLGVQFKMWGVDLGTGPLQSRLEGVVRGVGAVHCLNTMLSLVLNHFDI